MNLTLPAGGTSFALIHAAGQGPRNPRPLRELRNIGEKRPPHNTGEASGSNGGRCTVVHCGTQWHWKRRFEGGTKMGTGRKTCAFLRVFRSAAANS